MRIKKIVIKERNWNADLIRCVAVFSVICVHFFLNIGYYDQQFVGKEMFIMTVMRDAFMVCVPLFLMLTGYLMNKKELSKKYYRGILKTIKVYLLASIFCILFRVFYLNQEYTLKTGILSILNFNGAEYGWYIEMYLGLFLLIPFLNLIWNNLKNKKEKQVLIGTMLILSTLPSMLNIFDFLTPGFFADNTISRNYQQLVPDFFMNLYPLTYYFIGAYFKDEDINLSIKKSFILFICTVLILAIYAFWRNNGAYYDYGLYSNHWGAIGYVLTTFFVFNILLKIKINPSNEVLTKILYFVSKLSLGIYLVSFIPDRMIYPGVLSMVSTPVSALKFFPIIVIIIFAISIVISLIIDLLLVLMNKITCFVHHMIVIREHN